MTSDPTRPGAPDPAPPPAGAVQRRPGAPDAAALPAGAAQRPPAAPRTASPAPHAGVGGAVPHAGAGGPAPDDRAGGPVPDGTPRAGTPEGDRPGAGGPARPAGAPACPAGAAVRAALPGTDRPGRAGTDGPARSAGRPRTAGPGRATAKGAQRRAAVLDAAEGILSASGGSELTLRAVADAAGVRLGHLQYYFPSRADLLAALLDRILTAALHRVAALASPAGADATDATDPADAAGAGGEVEATDAAEGAGAPMPAGASGPAGTSGPAAATRPTGASGPTGATGSARSSDAPRASGAARPVADPAAGADGGGVAVALDAVLGDHGELPLVRLFTEVWAMAAHDAAAAASVAAFYGRYAGHVADFVRVHAPAVGAEEARARAEVFVMAVEGAALFRSGIAGRPSPAAEALLRRTLLGLLTGPGTTGAPFV
ncbi:TetR family transcriptional regulator [Streptomyces sp. NPDC101132]|uniref:TetR family transcriptional regulator n=1 Tax=Streptomyces sp. NPDC101132 TaxID=3366110 RepID=UPI0037FC3536